RDTSGKFDLIGVWLSLFAAVRSRYLCEFRDTFVGTMMVSDEEFIELVTRNRARIAAVLMYAPRVVGDPGRVIYNTRFPPNDTLFNVSSGRVEVGKDCFFGHGCMLLTGTHDHSKFGSERVDSYPKEGRDIILEEGVWLASGVIVLGPARIGNHAVVGAGSLVRGDLASYGIYVGNPAHKVGETDPAAHSSHEAESAGQMTTMRAGGCG